MISTSNVEHAKKLIKTSSKPVIIQAQDDSFNRKMLEHGKFDILLSIESGNRTDSLRHPNSGLNEIVARIASKNNVSIGIDLEDLRRLDRYQKAKRLTKIRQNISICRKTKTNIKVVSSQAKYLSKSLLLSLSASSHQSKNS